MARRNQKKAFGPIVALIVAAISYVYLEWQKTGELPHLPSGTPAPRSTDESPANRRQGNYETLAGCRLVEDRNNDGDSFVVDHDGREITLRLYFVDAPEKRRHQHNGERIGHQARYFDVSPDRAVAVGLEAKAFSLGMLEREPFTVLTLWEEVYDSGRYYAFVRFENGEYLAERLVKAGLARIYTMGEDLPDGRSMEDFKARLHQLESRARSAGTGGWNP